MHIAFWSPVSEKVKDYVTGNRAAKALSSQHTYFMVTHPGFLPALLDGYRATPIQAPVDAMWEKARTIIRHVRDNTDVDVLIRVDIDAIVFKPELLLNLAEQAHRDGAVIGNPGIARGTAVRGGCVIAARAALEALQLAADSNVVPDNPELLRSHDLPFSVELRRANIKVTHHCVFEENTAYTGTCAVWHPQKTNTAQSKLYQFNKNMKRFPLNAPAPAAPPAITALTRIKRKYVAACTMKSDINQHCERLYALAAQCRHVTEMGTRGAVSTAALLHARPEVLVCYDLCFGPEAETLRQLAKAGGKTKLKLVVGNTLDVTISPTDMLFIDTLHTRAQLAVELARHAPSVRKTIVMHDTATFGYVDEKTHQPGGLVAAITDFLASPAGEPWRITETRTNNNGLTVLERVK